MKKITIALLQNYVKQNIATFHISRLNSLDALKLNDILKRKNPYLYRTKNILTSQQIIQKIVDAHLSSNEETIFGNWLEGFAIFVNNCEYGGNKSGIPGIDLEFSKKDTRYIVSIKSGPNWGNSSQIRKMEQDFNNAKKTLRTSGAKMEIIAVNGCCYGKNKVIDKGTYFKYCGQQFWEFISGDSNFYTQIIEPLGFQAKLHNDLFSENYAKKINNFTIQFSKMFCDADGSINWKKLIEFNSGKN